MEAINGQFLDWAATSQPIGGQAQAADRSLVKVLSHHALIAALDGLGHGAEAIRSAELAIAVLDRYAEESLVSLVKRCHQSLIGERGVVMSLASFNFVDDTLTWLGIGNVAGVLLRGTAGATPPYQTLITSGGVVGNRLPPLSAAILSVERGDTLVLATDGISSDFTRGLVLTDPPQRMAKSILAKHNLGTDDSLVAVARYLGRND